MSAFQVSVGDKLAVHIDGADRIYTGTLRQVALDPAFPPHYALNEKERAQRVYLAEVLSTAQQGTYLRVLIDEHISMPEQWLRQQYPELMVQRTIQQVRPSLEDVFVQCTRQEESTGQDKRQ
ncbi:hypothetical protein [Endozoicomonas euniceicola]|uniref:DUF4162 domain-containing protein n=1 Tax=Endozoicomonas euniceicola TaxID=1234143 RepID=A0ABY6GNW4_9GAMM|nr:hypothetical protein [Endozoicomonas euniceicola]UYM14437.1 hypothetical protein NX720_16245 [Endozoicomonas euniceicola]